MTTLVVSIPPRHRLHAGQGTAVSPGQPEFAYVFSIDGFSVGREGQAAPALLPKADQVVALLPAVDVSWHRITCPRASAAKLGSALAGVLEEALLEDPQQLHFALAPGARGGESCWVAATDRASLAAAISAIESGGQRVDRIVPSAWPDDPASGHFDIADDEAGGSSPTIRVTWSHPDGVLVLPLQGALARTMLPRPLPPETRFSAVPAVAAPAERWLGQSVRVQSPADMALYATRSLWNLRQLGLAPRHRGASALREALRSFLSSSWRPVRWGLASLVAAQLVGLNLAAWQERSTLESKRAEMTQLLMAAHPQVRAVYDPAVQMQRETDLLRTSAGRSSEADFEAALQAAASAWPGLNPVQTLSFEAGRLTLAAPDWGQEQVETFRNALSAGGWAVEAGDGRLTLSRSTGGGA